MGVRALVPAIAIVGLALLACKKKSTTTSTGPAATATATAKPKPVDPPTPTQTFKLNEVAKLDGISITLQEFKDCRLSNFYSRRALSKKKQKLIGVLVLSEGNGDKSHSSSWSYFKVTDPEGLTYRATTRSGSDCSPTFKSTSLGKGEKSKGWVLFEVPETLENANVTMTYTNRRPYRSGADLSNREEKVKFKPGG
ncbi:MAG: DUF4352 domain-containing protein [Myxococcales bacterium]|nr:DUF4352 domain-containing protein [Myxococcales bacterium]